MSLDGDKRKYLSGRTRQDVAKKLNKALERKDREIAEAEEFYRDSAMEAATRLVCLLEVLQ